MEFIHQFGLSLFSIFALTALLISVQIKEEVYSYSNRLFRALIINMILINALEILSWVFDGGDGAINYVLNYGFNFVVIVITPAVAGFWTAYIDYKVHNDVKRIQKRILYQHVTILVLFVAIINFFTPILFSINNDNVYSREFFLWINLVLVYGLLAYALIIVFINRKRLKSDMLVVVSLFLLFPAGAALLQMFNLGLILMWPAASIAVIIAYLFLETQSAAKDYLTGLYNRSRADQYVERLIQQGDTFTVIMIDLDDYKKINDTFGHYVGDQVMIQFGNLLTTLFDSGSLVSRYGGDEFLIITTETDKIKIKEKKKKLQQILSDYDGGILHDLKFSYGYSQRTHLSQLSYDALLTEADDMMYFDKALNKNYKRRKDDK